MKIRFLSNGVTEACLNRDGEQPTEKERLANLLISYENTCEHIMRDVVM
jgi:hypothetical protein